MDSHLVEESLQLYKHRKDICSDAKLLTSLSSSKEILPNATVFNLPLRSVNVLQSGLKQVKPLTIYWASQFHLKTRLKCNTWLNQLSSSGIFFRSQAGGPCLSYDICCYLYYYSSYWITHHPYLRHSTTISCTIKKTWTRINPNLLKSFS